MGINRTEISFTRVVNFKDENSKSYCHEVFDHAKATFVYIFISEINRRNEIQLTHFIGQFVVPWLALFKISIPRGARPRNTYNVYYTRLDLIRDKIKAG